LVSLLSILIRGMKMAFKMSKVMKLLEKDNILT